MTIPTAPWSHDQFESSFDAQLIERIFADTFGSDAQAGIYAPPLMGNELQQQMQPYGRGAEQYHDSEPASTMRTYGQSISEERYNLPYPNMGRLNEGQKQSVSGRVKRRRDLTDGDDGNSENDRSITAVKKRKTSHTDVGEAAVKPGSIHPAPIETAAIHSEDWTSILVSTALTDPRKGKDDGVANNGNAEVEEDSAAQPPVKAKASPAKKPVKANTRIVKNAVRNTPENGLEVCIDGEWLLAIEHPDYVSHLPSTQIDHKQYMHERASGPGALNFTAYLASQHAWGKERANRPDILFAYEVPETGWNGSTPSFLRYRDRSNGVSRLVIDVINHRPLMNFANLPITISKKVEGWLMEAWSRQDRNIDVEDLIQRMPFPATDNVWTNKRFSNALTQRKERFRNRGRCLCWKKIEHIREWDKQLRADMEANPVWLNENTTRYLNDLTVAEDKALEATTFIKGDYQSRAGKRKLAGEARAEKEKKMRGNLGNRNLDDSSVAANNTSQDHQPTQPAIPKARRTRPGRQYQDTHNPAPEIQHANAWSEFLPAIENSQNYQPTRPVLPNVQTSQPMFPSTQRTQMGLQPGQDTSRLHPQFQETQNPALELQDAERWSGLFPAIEDSQDYQPTQPAFPYPQSTQEGFPASQTNQMGLPLDPIILTPGLQYQVTLYPALEAQDAQAWFGGLDPAIEDSQDYQPTQPAFLYPQNTQEGFPASQIDPMGLPLDPIIPTPDLQYQDSLYPALEEVQDTQAWSGVDATQMTWPAWPAV